MQPDPTYLLQQTGIDIPLIGFYDAPDKDAFEPLITPKPGRWACVFAFYKQWLKGKTLLLTKDNYGCGGAGNWLCGVPTRTRQEYIEFLTDDEGLKASHELMGKWLDYRKGYKQKYPYIFIGPLKKNQYEYLKTITFFVDPDRLSMLSVAAQYHSAPEDPPPVISPFGAGCMLMTDRFNNLDIPQSVIGATDMAMRHYVPANMLSLTVTKPMYERICSIGKDSFLSKSFISRLKKARKLKPEY